MMTLHSTTIRVMDKHMDAPDWREICEQEHAKPYWARNVLYAGANVSRRKAWYAKVDWDGVGWGFAVFLLAVLLVGCKCKPTLKSQDVRVDTHQGQWAGIVSSKTTESVTKPGNLPGNITIMGDVVGTSQCRQIGTTNDGVTTIWFCVQGAKP